MVFMVMYCHFKCHIITSFLFNCFAGCLLTHHWRLREAHWHGKECEHLAVAPKAGWIWASWLVMFFLWIIDIQMGCSQTVGGRNPAPIDRCSFFYPISCRGSTIKGGAGLLPSTDVLLFSTRLGTNNLGFWLRRLCAKMFGMGQSHQPNAAKLIATLCNFHVADDGHTGLSRDLQLSGA